MKVEFTYLKNIIALTYSFTNGFHILQNRLEIYYYKIGPRHSLIGWSVRYAYGRQGFSCRVTLQNLKKWYS